MTRYYVITEAGRKALALCTNDFIQQFQNQADSHYVLGGVNGVLYCASTNRGLVETYGGGHSLFCVMAARLKLLRPATATDRLVYELRGAQ